MSATDGSETMQSRIIYIGENHVPSGREHYMQWFLKENPELIDSEIKRINAMNRIDKKDRDYLKMLNNIK